MSTIRELSSFAFKHHGDDAELYNRVHDLETEMMTKELRASGEWFESQNPGGWFHAGDATRCTIEHAYDLLRGDFAIAKASKLYEDGYEAGKRAMALEGY